LQVADLNEAVRQTLALVRPSANERGIVLTADLCPELSVRCHLGRMQQVVFNLTLNAIQAVGTGGKVTIRTRRESPQAILSVHDTGPGIDPQHMDRLFTPYFTTKEPGQGTGLGLALCHQIVREHGGDIAVRSEVGAGAEFAVHIPLPSADLHRQEEHASQDACARGPASAS
jgi:signal transduction histidine kinase